MERGSDYSQQALLGASIISVAGCLPIIVHHCRWNCCRKHLAARDTKLQRLEACFGYAALCSVGFVSAFWLQLPDRLWPVPHRLRTWLRIWQLVQQQFCATGIAGWNCAICLEFRCFSRKLESALEKMVIDQEKFGGSSPNSDFMSEVQASWQTPAATVFDHMRAASETRRDGLLSKVVLTSNGGGGGGGGSRRCCFCCCCSYCGGGGCCSSSSILRTYHCVVWSACGFLTLGLSVANFVVFASPASLLANSNGMRVVVNVTQLAFDSGRAAVRSADRRQALYLEGVNSLVLYVPFLLTILFGFGVVIFSWWKHRQLSRRLLRAQPYFVAPTAGRLPLVIIIVCLLVPFGLPTVKRLVDLSVMIADYHRLTLGESGAEINGGIRAGADWGQTANVIWAISLGGQGVGTAGVGLMISLAKRAALLNTQSF